MLKSDFSKTLKLNEYEAAYKDFLLPVLICDAAFEVRGSNPAADSLYPHLTSPQGMRGLLGEFDLDDLTARLKRCGSLRIDGSLAFSDVRLNLVPILDNGEVAGVLAMLVGAQAIITPQELLKSSETPRALEKSIRQSVEDIFKAMDEAAYKADIFDSGWIKSSFQSIAQSSYYILRIASNISSYTSFQLQPPRLKLSTQDIFELIGRSSSVISGLSEKMGIPVRFSLPEHDGLAGVDAEKLLLAFYNILHNSFYFTRPGNEIEIIGEARQNEISLIIRDKGVGIPKKILPHIFKPYFSCAADGKYAGIGLGLPLAKIIVEAHGGVIDITSVENEGSETTFTIPKNIFSHRTPLGQRHIDYDSADRFSSAYIGLADAAGSPYHPS